MAGSPFSREVVIDGDGFTRCMRREGSPKRVHHMELIVDKEVEDVLCEKYGIVAHIDKDDKNFEYRRRVALNRFLGYDYVTAGVEKMDLQLIWKGTDDVTKAGGQRGFIEEHRGPITTWDEFERFNWPNPALLEVNALTWFDKHLPDDMVLIGGLTAHFFEELSWLFGYESLCYALYENRPLVKAVSDRLLQLYTASLRALLQFGRVRMVFASDDMGFKTGLSISPDDMREFVLESHKKMAQMCHERGVLYLLHSCGKLTDIMDELIDDVKIDAKHSFEDTIESVIDTKKTYGAKCSMIGGVDIDFLCRASAADVRSRVRQILDGCQQGGGYLLGTGNSVASYIPLDNYLAMIDEGRRYC